MERKIYSTSCIHFVEKCCISPERNGEIEWGMNWARERARERRDEEESRLLALQNIVAVHHGHEPLLWLLFILNWMIPSDLLPFLHQILTFLADILWVFVHWLCISIYEFIFIFQNENHNFHKCTIYRRLHWLCNIAHRKYHHKNNIVHICQFSNVSMWHTESDALLCLFLIHLIYLLQFYYWHYFIYEDETFSNLFASVLIPKWKC